MKILTNLININLYMIKEQIIPKKVKMLNFQITNSFKKTMIHLMMMDKLGMIDFFIIYNIFCTYALIDSYSFIKINSYIFEINFYTFLLINVFTKAD